MAGEMEIAWMVVDTRVGCMQDSEAQRFDCSG